MKKLFAGAFALLMFISFTAATVSALPPGLAKRGEGNLPPGLAKRLPGALPHGLQKRLADIQLNRRVQEKSEYETKIHRMDANNDLIVIKEGTAELHLYVAENADITLNGRSVSLSQLRKGDLVDLTLDNNMTITKIVAKNGEERDQRKDDVKVEGHFDWINSWYDEIRIEVGDEYIRYYLDEDVNVWINGTRSSLSQLDTDMRVVLWLNEDKEVIEIDAYSIDGYYDVKVISIIDTRQKRSIKVEINQLEREFSVAQNVSLSNIVIGSTIEIRLEDEVVTRIWK